MVNQASFNQAFDSCESAPRDESRAALSRLLIIEDALIHSTIISRVGESAGFLPTVARSYVEAVMILQERKFDCITLDLGLGEHAGLEVLQLLSSISCKATILIVSGADLLVCYRTVALGKSLGLIIHDPLQKPVDISLFRQRLIQINALLRLERGVGAPR